MKIPRAFIAVAMAIFTPSCGGSGANMAPDITEHNFNDELKSADFFGQDIVCKKGKKTEVFTHHDRKSQTFARNRIKGFVKSWTASCFRSPHGSKGARAPLKATKVTAIIQRKKTLG